MEQIQGNDYNKEMRLKQNIFDYLFDLVFYLNVPESDLIKRLIAKNGVLDYFESGRDIGLSTDIYNSFEIYQKRCLDEYKKLSKEYGFIELDGTKNKNEIHDV